MINYIVRNFVKNYEDIDNPIVRKNYGMLSSGVGIFCNVLLCALKFVIGLLSNSISIVSDGFNNLSDCASCIFTIFGYKMASKPADKDHPFGHGRMEYLTSLVIAAVIMVVGSQLFRTSIFKIIRPEKVKFSVAALVVLMCSILVKIWMGFFNLKLGKKINSSVMLATSKDSFSDVLATTVTIIALVSSKFTDAPVDGIMGLIVSALILYSGYGIIRETVDELLGQPADSELVNNIKEIVKNAKCARGMHDLIIHSYGPGNLIGSVHIEVDCGGNIMDIHDEIDELERQIYDELNVRMTIHMDPVDPSDERVNMYKELVGSILSGIDSGISMHDFRVVSGNTHTNLVFDVVVPYECKYSDREIKEILDDKLTKCKDKLYTVITFDKSYN